MNHRRIRSAVGPFLAGLLAVAAMPALAERIGQVRAVDVEEQTIVIDGRTYRLAQDLVPRHGDSKRIAGLQGLRSGMPVRYETDSGGTIVRLILLADE